MLRSIYYIKVSKSMESKEDKNNQPTMQDLYNALQKSVSAVEQYQAENKMLKDRLTAIELKTGDTSNLLNMNIEDLLNKKKEKIVRVAFMEGKLVVGFENVSPIQGRTKYVYDRIDKERDGQSRQFVKLLLADPETYGTDSGDIEVREVRYVEFLENANRIRGKVIEENQNPDKEFLGMVESKILPEGDNYRMIGTGVMVPNVVKWNNAVYTIKLDNYNNPVVLEDRVVNI